ncbi:MAG: hypothetical protein JWO82_1447 [Akkermansiaceae bacterium]|nr:hypothetical protein [Akkermansiaceae bacterium]
MSSNRSLIAKAAVVACVIVNLVLAFYLYAGCRTMLTSIGPSSGTMAFAAGFASIPFVISALGMGILLSRDAKNGRTRKGTAFSLTSLLGFASICGCAGAEVKVSADEIDFLLQVENGRRSEGVESLSRPRTWPCGSSSLLWEKSRGFWATD